LESEFHSQLQLRCLLRQKCGLTNLVILRRVQHIQRQCFIWHDVELIAEERVVHVFHAVRSHDGCILAVLAFATQFVLIISLSGIRINERIRGVVLILAIAFWVPTCLLSNPIHVLVVIFKLHGVSVNGLELSRVDEPLEDVLA